MNLITNMHRAMVIITFLAASNCALSQISPADIQKDIEYLASEKLAGRGTGSSGNDLAAKYIANQFKQFGLRPIGTNRQNDLSATMNGSGYYQPFEVSAGSTFGATNGLEIVSNTGQVIQRLSKTLTLTEISSSNSVSGSLVYVGDGVVSGPAGRFDYQSINAKGKIVILIVAPKNREVTPQLAAASTVRAKVMTARDQGAIGVIFIVSSQADIDELKSLKSKSDAGLPVVGVSGTDVLSWVKASGLNLGTEKQILSGMVNPIDLNLTAKLQTTVIRNKKATSNIVGLLPGSDPVLSKEVVVIGAHMDHLGMGGEGSLADDKTPQIHHGADDNASGTAGVLALAKYFSKSNTHPKRSLLFICFSGEEMGLLGSAHYVKSPIIPLASTAAMLNMDMIGRMVDNKLVVSGTGTSSAWTSLVDDVTRSSGFQISKSDSGFGASDQQSFYAAGIPVLFFFTGLHTDYHKPSDTADKINSKDEARVVTLVANFAEQISNMPQKPDYQKMTAPADTGGARFRVSLGSIPDYAANVEGVLLSGTRAGSPAEKAGLKQGDIIVKFGVRSIKSVQDYTVALGEHSPGDVVEIVVKRGTELVKVSVTLAGSKR